MPSGGKKRGGVTEEIEEGLEGREVEGRREEAEEA